MSYEKQKQKIHYLFNEQISIADSEYKLAKLIEGEYLDIKDDENNIIKPIYKIETEWEEMVSETIGLNNYYTSTLLQSFPNFKIEWIPFIKVVFLYKHVEGEYNELYPFLHNEVYKITEYDKDKTMQTITLSKSVRLETYWGRTDKIQVFGKWLIFVYNPKLIF